MSIINRRKVGMTSSLHDPYELGYTRATTIINNKRQWFKPEQI